MATLIGLALFTLIGLGIRLVFMMTIQQRRERMNRQINERLKTLIAAYKVLGGSFTGNLSVDPTHKRDLHLAGEEAAEADEGAEGKSEDVAERRRRIRDAVEAALADIILLGTDEHVRLAERAARELVAGHPVQTHELVVSLRAFIRKALDLEPIPNSLEIPMQGPTRPSSAGGGRGRNERGGENGRQGGGSGGGGAGGGMGGGGGIGMGGGQAQPGEGDVPPPR